MRLSAAFMTSVVFAANVAHAFEAGINRPHIDEIQLIGPAVSIELTIQNESIVANLGERSKGQRMTTSIKNTNQVVTIDIPEVIRGGTPVVFTNKTTTTALVVDRQPSTPTARDSACAKTLGVTGLVKACGQSVDAVCSGVTALIAKCVADRDSEVFVTRSPLPPRGSFEVRMKPTDLKPPAMYLIRTAEGATPAKSLIIELVPAPAGTTLNNTSSILEAVVVPLDSAGVASWRYTNPLNPACIRCTFEDNGTFRDANGVQRGVAFFNRTVDRSFIISLQVPKEVGVDLNARGIAECKADKPCTVSQKVTPQSYAIFDAALISAIPVTQLLKFDLSFFDESEKVPNATAYLSQAPAFLPKSRANDPVAQTIPIMAEPADDREFHTIGKMGTASDPAIPVATKNSEAAFPDHPCRIDGDPIAPGLCGKPERLYDGDRRHHYAGHARLEIKQNLGNRADVSATISYRESDLGGKDDGKIALREYVINTYSRLNIGFQFGRTTFFDAANKIALSERGDGYRWVARIPASGMTASFTHLLKRESESSTSDASNRDNHAWLLQVRGIGLPLSMQQKPVLRAFRTMDVFFIRGDEKGDVKFDPASRTDPVFPHAYRSAGVEFFYAFPNIGCGKNFVNCTTDTEKNLGNLAGSFAVFSSRRKVDDRSVTCDTSFCDGKGNVALLTLTWTPEATTKDNIRFTAKRSATLLLGAGTGDRKSTNNVDEGFIGPSPAFAPDTLFLGTFQAGTDTVQHRLIGPSLSNKVYVGIQYTDNTTSPLSAIAKNWLGVSPTDIASKSTVLKLHHYRFREPINGSSSAATEVDLEFQIESPKGINLIVGTAYLWPGGGVKPVIERQAWTLYSSVSLRL